MANAEVPIPRAVLYKASEIPTESLLAAAPPPLSSPSAENERIIPNTVPKRPNKVAIEAIVDKKTKFFSINTTNRATQISRFQS